MAGVQGDDPDERADALRGLHLLPGQLRPSGCRSRARRCILSSKWCRNPADKWPEYSLYVVAFGMLVTFLTKLGGSYRRDLKETEKCSLSKSTLGSWIVAVLALACASGGLRQPRHRQHAERRRCRKVEGYMPWEEETVEAVESLPVQEGGRIKPLSTYAGFTDARPSRCALHESGGNGWERIQAQAHRVDDGHAFPTPARGESCRRSASITRMCSKPLA